MKYIKKELPNKETIHNAITKERTTRYTHKVIKN